jgi:hypothetical protein
MIKVPLKKIENRNFYESDGTRNCRKTSSLKKRRTITGDPKGKDKGKGDIYTKVAIPRYIRTPYPGGLVFHSQADQYRYSILRYISTPYPSGLVLYTQVG